MVGESMMYKFHGKSGQIILSEWVLLAVIVMAALTIMSSYVRRAYQARIYDADVFMLSKAGNVFNNTIDLEYEPYYLNTSAITGATSTSSWASGSGAYVMGYADTKQQSVNTSQAPPMNAY